MGKLKVLKEGIEKAGKIALDMAHEARMRRAAEQGYDIDLLHGSPTLRESHSISLDHPKRTDTGYLGNAFYGTGPDNHFIAKAYAGNNGDVLQLKTSAKNFKDFIYDENYRKNIADYGKSIGVESDPLSSEWAQEFAQKMQAQGYEGARGLADDGSIIEYAIYDPSKVRSVNAAFDPAQRESSNLLAGVAGAAPIAGLAALGAGTSQNADASTSALSSLGIAATQFNDSRAQKQSHWQQLRQDVTDLLSMGADNAFAALDKPLQGYLALTSLAGNLAAGNGWGNAVQQAAQVARQPSDATTYQLGGTTTDALAPYVPAPVAAAAGTAVNAGIQFGSPF